MNKPLILITNDDGISSPGLKAAVESIEKFGEVVVVAPSNQQTSMGRSLWGNENEHLNEMNFEVNSKTITAYHCDCSPARIVLHAIDVLFSQRKPSLVVSGINYGENLGSNVTISGTVGAAIQGSSMGIPSLAVSLQTEIEFHHKHGDVDWNTAKFFTSFFVKRMLSNQLPDDVDILNVNIPSSATHETAWEITHLSKQPYFSNHIESANLSSRIGDAEVTIAVDEASLDTGSDINAIMKEQVVSVTPLSLDMTSRTDINDMRKFLVEENRDVRIQ